MKSERTLPTGGVLLLYFCEMPAGAVIGRALLFGIFSAWRGKILPEGSVMKKEEEKKPLAWEMSDEKPPVIQSGRMENRKEN